jgi:predicted RNA-binding Zn-ribbon protein involved in translation (DUF1610 family)
MNIHDLIREHRTHSPLLAQRPPEALLLWYADLALEVHNTSVHYRCPGCGTPQSMPVEEFVYRDSNEDLWCDTCRGDLEERGGPMA